MLTEVPSEGATISAFTLAGGRIDKFIFMHFNNNIQTLHNSSKHCEI